MRLVFDTTVINLTRGGVAVYAKALLSALRARTDFEVVPLECPCHFRTTGRLAAKMETAYRDLVWQEMILPRRIGKAQADIYHSPQARTTLRSPIPTVATVHDLYSFHNPAGFSRWTAFNRRIFPSMLRHVEGIIVVSEFTKREILRFFPEIDPGKITVVPHGVSPHYRPASEEACHQMRASYSLPDRYVLAVNTLEPRKNLLPFIRAFDAASSDIEEELVLIGTHGWIPDHLREVLHAIDQNPRIHYLGYVPNEDLAPLYTAATAYVFPSLYEGFGLPAIEAMACECPVAASRGSALDEVVADAGLQFDPNSVEEMAQSLVQICRSSELRADLVKKGTRNVQRFTWQNAAAKTAEAYRLAMNR